MSYGGAQARGDRDALDRVLADARAVQIREMRGDSKSLLVERDPVAVQALREALHVTDEPGSSCMCFGDVSLIFLDAAGRELTGVTLHHGDSVRWNDAARWGGWRDDAILVDSERSLEWLAVRGITWPLREFRESQRRMAEALRVQRLWAADIPELLTEYTPLFLETSNRGVPLLEPELIEVRERLLSGYPAPVDRIIRLLTWYGSGTGTASGYPTHEAVPAQFIDLERDEDIARAVEAADARAALGAVRYLVSWPGRQRIAPLLKHLSPAAQRKILERAPTADTRSWLERRIARPD